MNYYGYNAFEAAPRYDFIQSLGIDIADRVSKFPQQKQEYENIQKLNEAIEQGQTDNNKTYIGMSKFINTIPDEDFKDAFRMDKNAFLNTIKPHKSEGPEYNTRLAVAMKDYGKIAERKGIRNVDKELSAINLPYEEYTGAIEESPGLAEIIEEPETARPEQVLALGQKYGVSEEKLKPQMASATGQLTERQIGAIGDGMTQQEAALGIGEEMTPAAKTAVSTLPKEKVDPWKMYEEKRGKEIEQRESAIKTMSGLTKSAGFNAAIIESKNAEEGLISKGKTLDELIKTVSRMNNLSAKQISGGKQSEMQMELEKMANELNIPTQYAADTDVLSRLRADIDSSVDTEKERQKQYANDLKEFKSREKQELDIKRTKASKTGGTPAGFDDSDLTPQQRLAARELAILKYGKRQSSWMKGYPDIVAEIRSGKSVDTIEDEMRYSRQSEAFSGPARSAMQQIFIGKGGKAVEGAFNSFDDVLESGNKKSMVSFLKKSARATAPVAQRTLIEEKERTVDFLKKIQKDLEAYEAAGGKTGLFAGAKEEVAKRLRTVSDPKLRELATKIQTSIQRYRKAITGAAFNAMEGKEFNDIFPSISRTHVFNMANINALLDVFSGDTEHFYSNAMGSDAYNELIAVEEAEPTLIDATEHSQSEVAEKWAIDNPDDPRAQEILKRLNK